MKFKTKLAYTSIVLAALAACGGGGGGSTDSTVTPTPTPAPATNGGNLATSVPTPTYAAGSTLLTMFNQINDVRLKGGFGMLAQDVALDAAATNHANYVLSNYYIGNGLFNNAVLATVDPVTGWLMGHVETKATPGFTGVLPIDRATASGVVYKSVGEVAGRNTPDCVGTFVNSVFHRSALLNTDYQTVGISPNVKALDGFGTTCVINFGYKSVPQTRPAGWIGIYPGNSQTGVPIQMAAGENPNPAPAIPDGQKGMPVSIYLNSPFATINSFTLTPLGSTVQVPVIQITYVSFPTYLTKTEAHILPTQLLASKTTYNVNFSGALTDGTNVTKSWSFTTQ